jgi:hypothetical protein
MTNHLEYQLFGYNAHEGLGEPVFQANTAQECEEYAVKNNVLSTFQFVNIRTVLVDGAASTSKRKMKDGAN